MNIQFLGAAHEVTGSCTLLSAAGRHILVDCGMEQGADIYENCELPVNPADIDCVLLTHAHIDHSGKLPNLVAKGYTGPIYATVATTKLCDIMLRDSAHIQEFEAEWRNRKAKRSGAAPYVPLYTSEDVANTMPLFKGCDYKKTYDIFDGIKIRFIDAGHLLGSSSIEITVNENGTSKTVLFSGDIGNVSRPLIRDPEKPDKADYVIIESTYGDRLHGPRKDYASQLVCVLKETFDRGGNVVIPSFAVGRTQELLYIISEIKQRGALGKYNDFPVYIDSPLAIEATRIYAGDMMDYYDEDTLALIKKGINPLNFEGLKTAVTTDESMLINDDPSPKVIISASGMCEAGRIRHHLKHNLWRRECTVLFVGYQSNGTLGRAIVEGAKTVKLFGETVQVNAHIETIEGISGHADSKMLLDWLSALKNTPTRVFVNHGEDSVCTIFAGKVAESLGYKSCAPYNGAVYDLTNDTCLAEGNKTRLVKESSIATRTVATLFEKLLTAARRLMEVVEHNKGGTNKDISAFTRDINDLCNKWDR